MPDAGDTATVRIVDSLSSIDPATWDACAGIGGPDDNPFVSHAFLLALEESGSVGADAGWLPQHVIIESPAGDLIAAAPMYVKGHSYGEYVFDHAWADAYERAGGRYYPKLLCAVPFTPVTGPRLLVPVGPDAPARRSLLISALTQVANKSGMSSLHVNFLPEADAVAMKSAGFALRIGEQFHWENDGYTDFDTFLAALTSRKRKAIKKERRAVAEAGIEVQALTGDAIRQHHWDAFHEFYVATYDRKWGYPYLTRSFFSILSERLADRVVLVMAEKDGLPLAGALNMRGSDALFGRNWGCAQDHKFLHFETCYYQAIAFAIEYGIGRVEAGTQGPHKIQRGYLPKPTWSAHWFADSRFQDAIGDYCDRERHAIEDEMRYLAQKSPFRNDCAGD